jgi:hypothetical protein
MPQPRRKSSSFAMRLASMTFGAAIAVTSATSPADAEVTQADLLVAGRAIDFIDNLKHGDERVGIVYDPAIAPSSQQADELRALMAGGLRIGNLTLKPVMVPIGQLGNGFDLVFLTEGVDAGAAKVGRIIRQRRIACITFDLVQVRNGNCVIGVRTHPKIEVLVNRAAAEASGTDLAAVFRIMITEI